MSITFYRAILITAQSESDSLKYLEHDLLSPVLRQHGYALEIPPESTPNQRESYGDFVQLLIDADLVIFDLAIASNEITYRMGLRHMSGRPALHMSSALKSASAPDHLNPFAPPTAQDPTPVSAMPPEISFAREIHYDVKDARVHTDAEGQIHTFLADLNREINYLTARTTSGQHTFTPPPSQSRWVGRPIVRALGGRVVINDIPVSDEVVQLLSSENATKVLDTLRGRNHSSSGGSRRSGATSGYDRSRRLWSFH